MRRFALLLVGVAMLGSTVGCHCLFPYGCGPGGYGFGGFGGGCGPAGCPPATLGAPGTYPGTVIPPQGAYHSSYDTMQAGIPGAFPVIASRPTAYTAGYQPAATGPLESLPTY